MGSAVCTSCGTLTDPSQSVLTSQIDFPDGSTRYSGGWDFNSVKRSRSNWALADQGKEVREKRNSVCFSVFFTSIDTDLLSDFQAAILEFIKSLARSLNATGLSPRTMNLFRQAKDAMQFRWGRKAKLVAGASLAVALRESNRPDCLRDISFLLEEPFPALSRAFMSITTALNLSLNRIETSSYIPILQQHMSSLMKDRSNSLPATLVQELSSISLHAASNTASSLSDILSRIGTASVIQGPTPPIACAIFVLSLESELRTTIKHLTSLSQVLGTRLNVGKGAVMASYKAMQDALASLAENVPWLDKYESKNGRARVAKRNVVARATKDIVAFYNDAWRETKKPNLNIVCEKNQDQDAFDDDEQTVPRKKRKTKHRVAMQFLLDPVTTPLPTSTKLLSLDTSNPSTPQHSINPLLTYYLSGHMTSHKPTRLQLLAAVRGGADQISDSELFEEGEIEGLMRSEEEMKVVGNMYDWARDEEAAFSPETSVPRTSKKLKHSSRDDSKAKEHQSRINLDALARFLNNDDDDDSRDDRPFNGLLGAAYDSNTIDASDSSEAEDEDETTNPPPPHESQLSPITPGISTDDEVIIEEWRPASPEGHGGNIVEDRYDGAYD